jgi:hypothetical protein
MGFVQANSQAKAANTTQKKKKKKQLPAGLPTATTKHCSIFCFTVI